MERRGGSVIGVVRRLLQQPAPKLIALGGCLGKAASKFVQAALSRFP